MYLATQMNAGRATSDRVAPAATAVASPTTPTSRGVGGSQPYEGTDPAEDDAMRSNPLPFTQQFLLLALTAAGLTACVDDVVVDADDPEAVAESISLMTSGDLVLYEGSCVSWTSLPRDLPATVDTAVSYLTMTSRERTDEGIITTTITARTADEQAKYGDLVSDPCSNTAAWECTTWISHDSGHAEPMAVCTSGTITCGVGHGQGWCTGT